MSHIIKYTYFDNNKYKIVVVEPNVFDCKKYMTCDLNKKPILVDILSLKNIFTDTEIKYLTTTCLSEYMEVINTETMKKFIKYTQKNNIDGFSIFGTIIMFSKKAVCNLKKCGYVEKEQN